MIPFSVLVARGRDLLIGLGVPEDERCVILAQELFKICLLFESDHNLKPFDPTGNACGLFPTCDEAGIEWFLNILVPLNARKRRDYSDPLAHDLTIRISQLKKYLLAALSDGD